MNTAILAVAAFVIAVGVLWKPVGALLSWWSGRKKGEHKRADAEE